jgi:hypothetical protein
MTRSDCALCGDEQDSPLITEMHHRISLLARPIRSAPVTAHKALGGGLRISKALVKGKALAKGASKALAYFSHASRRYQKQ